MVIAAVGAGLMRAGAAVAGSTSARSVAGSVLSTGGGSVTTKAIQNIEKHSKKIMARIEQSSPLLKQQMILLRKSVELFLRPIGDIMAKFLRPMAIMVFKMARKWMELFGGSSGKKGGDPEDLKKQLEVQKTAAVERGDTATAEQLQKQINTINAATLEKSQTLFGKIGEQLSELWSNITDIFGGLWEFLKPRLEPVLVILKAIGFVIGLALLGALTVLNFLLKGISTVIEIINVGTEWMLKLFWEFLDWIGEISEKGWTKLSDFFTKKLPSLWVTFIAGVKDMVNKIIDWIKSLNPIKGAGKVLSNVANVGKSIVKGVKGLFGGAGGGSVTQSGSYNLHAGEYIMRAGDVQRLKGKSSGGVSVNNTFNIQGGMGNNEMELRSLARKLAEYSEREIRRRVSYI
jgi:hypothetical protein